MKLADTLNGPLTFIGVWGHLVKFGENRLVLFSHTAFIVCLISFIFISYIHFNDSVTFVKESLVSRSVGFKMNFTLSYLQPIFIDIEIQSQKCRLGEHP
jgi:hypothetical protein